MTNKLAQADSQIAKLVKQEKDRQQNGLNLIASENYPSQAVLETTGTILTAKYAEGYPKKRYYSGAKYVDQIEKIAIERAKKLFKAEYVNVQPHAGSQANQAVYFALLKPGDRILSMDLASGGHLTHGSQVNFSGQTYKFYHYGVSKKTGLIDFSQVEKIARKIRPKMIICGASAYPRKIDFAKFSKIAKKNKAILLADIAHIAGLIVAGQHQSCFPYVDVATSTTHKTLRGPRGGLILAKKEFGSAIDRAVFPTLQGGPFQNVIAAKAVCFKEAQNPKFKKYQKQVIKNAKALADSLKQEGLSLVANGTDNHLVLIDLRNLNIGGKKAQDLLEKVNIYTNKNAIPFDEHSPANPSGLRLGTPALTTRGFKEKEMKIIGKLIADVLKGVKINAKVKVKALTKKHSFYENN